MEPEFVLGRQSVEQESVLGRQSLEPEFGPRVCSRETECRARVSSQSEESESVLGRHSSGPESTREPGHGARVWRQSLEPEKKN